MWGLRNISHPLLQSRVFSRLPDEEHGSSVRELWHSRPSQNQGEAGGLTPPRTQRNVTQGVLYA